MRGMYHLAERKAPNGSACRPPLQTPPSAGEAAQGHAGAPAAHHCRQDPALFLRRSAPREVRRARAGGRSPLYTSDRSASPRTMSCFSANSGAASAFTTESIGSAVETLTFSE